MDKTAYKTQMTYPIPNTAKLDGRCCQPYGRTTTLWGAGKSIRSRVRTFRICCFANGTAVPARSRQRAPASD